MKADPKVIADLLTACGTLATMAEQFRIDEELLEAIDLDYLAGKVGKWYHKSEKHLETLLERLIAFGGNAGYTVGKLQGAGGDVATVLQRDGALLQAAFDQFCVFRKKAYDIRADYTPDDYEHAIHDLEKMIISCEKQMALIDGLGPQAYIGSRLEDGD